MTTEKEIAAQGNGRREQSENARLALSIMDRIHTITPADLLNMSWGVLREVMVLMGMDPDQPLPDEITQLIEKIRREADEK